MINMRRLLKRSIGFLMLLNCGIALSLSAQEIGQTVGDGSLNLTVLTQGSVFFKRPGWSIYAPLAFGTSLQSGDLVRLDEGRAQVVCSDLTLHDLSPGMSGIPCNVTRPVLYRDGSMINPTRGHQGYQSHPVVITPRKTKLLSDHFVIRWTPLPGVTSYRVTIRGADFNASQVVQETTEIYFPGHISHSHRLKPGTYYKIIVEASNEITSFEPGLGLGFSVLSSSERKEVEREEQRIRNLHLDPGPTQFLIGNVYAGHELRAEAIQSLETAFETFKTAALARLLGDLYLAVGLIREAESRYASSLDLAKSDGDPEGQLIAHRQLATVYERELGNRDAAKEQLDSVIMLAHRLGDEELAAKTQTRLIALRGTRGQRN